MILIIAIIAITTTFIQTKKTWLKFLISAVISTVLCIGIMLSFINGDRLYHCILALISLASTILFFAAIQFINKVLNRMSLLAQQSIYTDQYYLVPNALQDHFNTFIKNNNVSQALILTLSVRANDNIKSKLLNKIYETFNDGSSIFFKNSNEEYGIVLTGEKYKIRNLDYSLNGNNITIRPDDDNLKYLELQLQRCKIDKTSIWGYASIYGVHDVNLNNLIKNNQFLIKNTNFQKSRNIVQLFDSNQTYQEINDDIAFYSLSQEINLNDISIDLELLKLNKTKQVAVYPRFY